jgi:UDP-GlcNAc3NAcA epimerase
VGGGTNRSAIVATRKILTVIGARPQFVKAAVVSRAIADHVSLEETILHTGQHFDTNMSAVFFDELGIPQPAYHLAIGGGSHGQNTGRMIEAIEATLMESRPDMVMVYGDTDSTLAGAIAASKLNIPIAHVEAGLRSFNRRMPEEINRIVTDHVSDLLFAPSQTAVANLAHEGIAGIKVKLVGDVMFDAVKVFTSIAREKSSILKTLNVEPGNYVLVTLHRKENTDDATRLSEILTGLSTSDHPVILPLHPRTRRRIAEHALAPSPHIRIVDPVGYLDMMLLEAHARVIATDSGGVQKEAYFHGVPCVTMRDETEWVELLEIGANRLAGANATKIAEAIAHPGVNPSVRSIYGDGTASLKIAEIIAGHG